MCGNTSARCCICAESACLSLFMSCHTYSIAQAARVSMYLQGGLQQLATCLGGLCPDTSDRDTTADLDAIEEAVSDPKYATRALCLLVGMLSNHCYMAAARRWARTVGYPCMTECL